jgi:hypothetical protein
MMVKRQSLAERRASQSKSNPIEDPHRLGWRDGATDSQSQSQALAVTVINCDERQQRSK